MHIDASGRCKEGLTWLMDMANQHVSIYIAYGRCKVSAYGGCDIWANACSGCRIVRRTIGSVSVKVAWHTSLI